MRQVKHNLYVGCGLTHAPEVFVGSVERLKKQLEFGWNIMEFLGLQGGSPEDVYRKDIEDNIRTCDAFLAIADFPSTGLGWELGVADEREVPALIVSHDGATVSRLLAGAGGVRDNICYKLYGSMDEIPGLVDTHLRPMLRLDGRMEEK